MLIEPLFTHARSRRIRQSGFLVAALLLSITAAGCGATRKPLERSRPWQVATDAVTRPPPAPTERRSVVAESAPVRVDPRLREKVTLRSEATDLRSLLLGLSKQTQINIVLGDEVRGTVSAYLNDVPVLDALYQILRPMGFDLAIEDGFVRVYRPGLETRIYRIHYLRDLRIGTNMTTVSAMSVGGGMMGGGTSGGMSGGMGGMSGGGMGGMSGGGMGGMSGGGMGGGMSGGGGMGMDNSSTMLTSMFMVNFWDDLGDELESMIFQGEKPSKKQAQTNRMGGAGGGQMMQLLKHGRSVADDNGRALTMNSMSGTIVVTAPRQTLDAIGDYIKAVEESVQRQVVIEMRILEVALTNGNEFGVDARNIPLLPSQLLPDIIPEENLPVLNARFGFGDFHGTDEIAPGAKRPPIFGFGSGDQDTDWSTVVTALARLGDVQVVSAPRISALHNQKAIVKVVKDRVFYLAEVKPTVVNQTTTTIQPIQFVPVVIPEGVVVDVTPLIDDEGNVTLEVHPSFSVIFNEKQAPNGQGSMPEVERREFHSTVRVKNEQTVVLGGLVTERTVRSEAGIPLLKDIPFLGALFRHTEERIEKAELIVLLTPRLQGDRLAREYVNSLRATSGQGPIEDEEYEEDEEFEEYEEYEEYEEDEGQAEPAAGDAFEDEPAAE